MFDEKEFSVCHFKKQCLTGFPVLQTTSFSIAASSASHSPSCLQPLTGTTSGSKHMTLICAIVSALTGLNINPTLINIGGSGDANIAVGYSVSPSLISIQPAVEATISVGQSEGKTKITENIIPRPPTVPKPSPKPQPPDPGPSPKPMPPSVPHPTLKPLPDLPNPPPKPPMPPGP